ncbi:MAG: GNVR domain-containing protein [Flavihumibacter sp.]|nr:GNVR domain-containing protein [Flavihumibacter sp.]
MTEANKNLKLLRPLLRGLPIIIAVVMGAVSMAKWYLDHTVPMFESMARVKLADPTDGPSSANLYKDFDVFSNKNKIGTEIEIMKSKALVEKTLDSIDMETVLYRIGKVVKKELYHEAPFKPVIKIKNHKWYDKPFSISVNSVTDYTIMLPGKPAMKGVFGQPILSDVADIILMKNERLLAEKPNLSFTGTYEVIVNSREKIVDQIVGKLDITSVDKDIPILRIIYTSPVPEKAADYVNVLAKTYIADYVENKYKAANTTVNFLNNQLQQIGNKLDNSETAIEDYRNNGNIINIRQETETDLRKIAQMKIQLANLHMNLAAIDTLNNYIQRGKDNFLQVAPNFEAFTDLLSTEMIKKVKQLQSEKKDLLIRYTETNDKVKVVDEKLDDVFTYFVESIKNTKENYEIKYKEIDNAIKEMEKVFIGLPTKEKEMTVLERDFGLNQKTYMFLHEKKTEAEIARAATISFHKIIAYGEVPAKPVSPNRVLIIAVSAILAILGSTFLIYTVHAMKAKVNDSSVIEKNSITPLVAEVLMQRREKDRVTHFNNVAIQLELRNVIKYPAVIAFTSFAKREGKSYVAANLARGIVSLNKKVLLVDVGGTVPDKQGWFLQIIEGASVYKTPVNNLFYYRANEESKDQVVIQEQLQAKINEWKKTYDAILIRNNPIGDYGNTLVFMAVADVNMFVLDSRKTPAKNVLEADVLKEKFNIPNMKFVLNRAYYNPSVLVELWDMAKSVISLPRTLKETVVKYLPKK